MKKVGRSLVAVLSKRLAVWVVVLAGLLAMGAGPAAGVAGSAAAAIRAVLPTPRLFRVSTEFDANGGAGAPYLLCLGAESLTAQLSAARGETKIEPSTPAGCTFAKEHGPGGSVRLELACDRSERNPVASRMSLEVGAGFATIHQRMASQVGDAGTKATMTFEVRAAQVGDCPAGMNPGEARSLDGARLDSRMGPTFALLALAAVEMGTGVKVR